MRIHTLKGALIGTAAAALLAASMPATATGATPAGGKHPASPKPTIVLVHGAWADSSSWNPVIKRLRKDGYPVRAIANPLQGLTSDTAYLSSYLTAIEGPKVLVGHSYGGAVITNAATSVPDVKSLVYIAAFIPAKGETIAGLTEGSDIPLTYTPVPGGVDVAIDPAEFPEVFAGDLDKTTAANLAVTQRPANSATVTDASVVEGYRTIPSWALLTRRDHAIDPALQRMMVGRAGAHVTEVDASHAVMLSRPGVVTDVIERAAR
ncbi:alpha/beta hydrolase [Mumia sp. zg.B21]|uniref:alpha/beta fold hydrolase n=1 Tax=Mumia sp. zg.B21 TaxID=2855447 RepID=UPI001C6E8911|nr:alpha/beta hydrolase [Mumia sp. zg.B21]MBW9209131.1 alpha/beta hydrolase [Mumia sp. zg.B21]